MGRNYTKAEKLEWKLILMVFLALLTMSVMSRFIDRYGTASASGEGQVPGAAPASINRENTAYNGIIRFHVHANSDSEEDQQLKLKVRDQVMVKIQRGLMDEFSREMAVSDRLGLEVSEMQHLETTRRWLQENLEEIEDWAQDAVREEGEAYPVKASLGITWIPERQYDGIYFPAGNYEALTLDIGEGKGQNWWCVIFPPLCLIDSGQSWDEADAAQVKSWLASAGGGRIVLKSRILELLKAKSK